MDLLIRAAHNDHAMLEKLCAPASAGLSPIRRLPLSALVADATVAAQHEQLAKLAAATGIPYLIDPTTSLLQDVQAPDHAWAQLPFATPRRLTPEDFMQSKVQDRFIEATLNFQRAHGASLLIPPYLYSPKHADAWFEVNLQLLQRSGDYLQRHSVDLPVVPVLAASLMEYGPQATWTEGIDRYLTIADTMNLRCVALSLSTSSPGKESYDKLAYLLTATRHAAQRHPVIGWRQGLYGLAMTACGASGYETGAGQNERCHFPDFNASRRPKPPKDDSVDGGGGGAYVYFSTFNRSLPRDVGAALLANPHLRGSLVCTDESGCCPDGAISMTKNWREHAVRSRARQAAALEQMPPSLPWRLNSIARDAERSATAARLGNTALQEAGIGQRLPEDTYRALARVANELRAQAGEQAA